MTDETFDSVWDAIEDTPQEAENTRPVRGTAAAIASDDGRPAGTAVDPRITAPATVRAIAEISGGRYRSAGQGGQDALGAAGRGAAGGGCRLVGEWMRGPVAPGAHGVERGRAHGAQVDVDGQAES